MFLDCNDPDLPSKILFALDPQAGPARLYIEDPPEGGPQSGCAMKERRPDLYIGLNSPTLAMWDYLSTRPKPTWLLFSQVGTLCSQGPPMGRVITSYSLLKTEPPSPLHTTI